MKHHTKEKGDIAVAKIIADLTEKGYDILLPISEHLPFDLIAYKDHISHRIQCKYATDGIAKSATSWSDKNGNHRKKYDINDFDYFGLYLPDLKICVYPHSKYMGCTITFTLPNSAQPFYWYEDFLQFTSNATHKTYKDFNIDLSKTMTEKSVQAHIKSRKVERPNKEDLEKLLWEKPTIQIAKQFGVSDKAVEKWAKQYKINKPPRGYWSKQSALVIPRSIDLLSEF
jgi:hypothetical protein